MIFYIKGYIEHKSQNKIIVETNGIGYQIFIPLSTYQKLPSLGEIVKIFIYYHVREDAVTLYGFYTLEERELFELLITVSSIGAKTAINILSDISINDFKKAVVSGDIVRLTNISGIGKKTAQRIILELKDKIGVIAEDSDIDFNITGDNIVREACDALVILGYKYQEAKRVILLAREKLGEKAGIEEYIKEGLRHI
ncbi:Holliday junction branch migration protein RuvA [Candidatus Poribacteria bacterium]|nr:Holliday junction branch migration protein RuvA [Candidatus Poribacteria bacterium]